MKRYDLLKLNFAGNSVEVPPISDILNYFHFYILNEMGGSTKIGKSADGRKRKREFGTSHEVRSATLSFSFFFRSRLHAIRRDDFGELSSGSSLTLTVTKVRVTSGRMVSAKRVDDDE